MQKGRAYFTGAILTLVGGTGLAEIQMTSHGCFWLCAITFSVGLAMCIWSYK